jgi:hypothetical protein
LKRITWKQESLAASAEKKPTVLSGVIYGDAWFMPGGQNYAAKLINDAGAAIYGVQIQQKVFCNLASNPSMKKRMRLIYGLALLPFQHWKKLKMQMSATRNSIRIRSNKYTPTMPGRVQKAEVNFWSLAI